MTTLFAYILLCAGLLLAALARAIQIEAGCPHYTNNARLDGRALAAVRLLRLNPRIIE